MNEPKAENGSPRVTDHRRFDPDGSPREEEAGAAPAEAAEPPELLQLRQELEAARKRVDELARAYQALQVDREEFKQRLSRERDRLLDVERGKVVTTLLEAIDDLDLCLQASAQDSSSLATGVRLIRDKLLSQVTAQGVERIQTVGQTFDPAWAEATDMEMTTDPDNDQRVTAEHRAGYRLKERVLRPARVRVARFVRPASA